MRFMRQRPSKTVAPNLDQSLVLHLSKSRIPSLRQLKYVNRFLSQKERIIVWMSLLVVLGSLIFMGVIFYKRNFEISPSQGGNYSEGVIGNPQYINPLYASLNDSDADLEQLIFSRLFSRDAEGLEQPDLADTVTISADAKTYTITLKQAVWQNGNPLTADDVVFTLKLIQNIEYKSPLRTKFIGVNVSKTDDQTVVFTLREPYHNFLRLLNFGIMPQNVWGGIPAQTMPLAGLNIKPIGSGPYQFKSLVKNKNGTIRSYILERNPTYYGQAPYLDEITFKFFPSAEEMVAALNNGQINGLSYLDQETIDSIVAKNSFSYHTPALPELTALFFNLKSKGVIADKTIRQALSLAINQNSVVGDSVGLWGTPAQSLLPSFVPGSNDAFRYDLDRANELLDRDSWPKQEDGKRSRDDKQLTISLIAPENLKDTAEAIKRAWEIIGVKTELTLKSEDVIEKEIISNRQFEVILYRQTLMSGDPYPLWHSDGQGNISGWEKTEIDAWLEDARLGSDETVANRYERFLTLAADEIPARPLFWRNYVYLQGKKIKGFSIKTVEDPAERLLQTSNWYINTKHRLKSTSAKATEDKE